VVTWGRRDRGFTRHEDVIWRTPSGFPSRQPRLCEGAPHRITDLELHRTVDPSADNGVKLAIRASAVG
jgi:hypothetical protein